MRVGALFGEPWAGALWISQTRVDPWTFSSSPSRAPLYTVLELAKESVVQVPNREGSDWKGEVSRESWGGDGEDLAPNHSLRYSVLGVGPFIKHSVQSCQFLGLVEEEAEMREEGKLLLSS